MYGFQHSPVHPRKYRNEAESSDRLSWSKGFMVTAIFLNTVAVLFISVVVWKINSHGCSESEDRNVTQKIVWIPWNVTNEEIPSENPYVICGGVAGPPGKDGLPGAKGDTGSPGIKGEMGSQGLNGIPGDPGQPGRVGEMGKQGISGKKGERGPMGEKGKKGDPGIQLPALTEKPVEENQGPTGPPGDRSTTDTDYVTSDKY